MERADAAIAWDVVCGADCATLDRAGVAEVLGAISRVRSICDAVEVDAVRRGQVLADNGAAEEVDSLLAKESARSSREARTAADRATTCTTIPAFHRAMVDGSMSAGHVDAATTALRRADDSVAEEFASLADVLVRRAGAIGVDDFARECSDLLRDLTTQHAPDTEVDELERQRRASKVKRWVDRHSGMHHTLVALDPLRDATMWKVINAEVARRRSQQASGGPRDRSWDELQSDAFVTSIAGDSTVNSASDGGPREPASRHDAGCRVPEVSIHIDWATLRDGALGICETDDGTALPVATVRRLCCEAMVLPVVLGARGDVLDQGRRQRTVTRPQRRALAAMHRTCAHPGCTIGFDGCKIHHVKWWWKHLGPSDLDNLLPLCERHHHLVHEGGWQLTMTADRVATWTRPDGVVHHRGSTIDRHRKPIETTSDEPPRDFPLRI